ncbi:helix-turn-helix domain-containing protein [Bradyrhizobium sp.]|jgi:transcriptional regulator with XRE-family HTH domain|uniref:helix-turn-helix domain-containing protein n=1 Tax=Bradyrhizobium sp. TaxID=376 RepID=UPI003C1DDAE7
MARDQQTPTMSRAGRTKSRSVNAIDQHVGQRIRAQRLLKGMSQQALAGALDLTFQQVQKYERGVNRIGAGRLSQIAAALGTSIGFFYEGAPGASGPESGNDARMTSLTGFLATKNGQQLVRSFEAIPDGDLRQRILALMAALSRRPTEK